LRRNSILRWKDLSLQYHKIALNHSFPLLKSFRLKRDLQNERLTDRTIAAFRRAAE
jgi:hypothetical protein